MIGIKEETFLMRENEIPQEMCSGQPCEYKYKYPHCQFLEAYRKHIFSLSFFDIISEFKRVAEEVRKVTQFKGEPIIVLLVHEKPENECSERLVLRQWFEANGQSLPEWTRESGGLIF